MHADTRQLLSHMLVGVIALLIGVVIALLVRSSGTPLLVQPGARNAGIRDELTGNCSAAIRLLSPVVLTDPADLGATEALDSCYIDEGDYGLAIRSLSAIEKNDTSYYSAYLLAQAACDAGQESQCAAAFKVATVRTANPPILLTIAQSEQSYSQLGLAVQTLDRILPAQRTYTWYATDSEVMLSEGKGQLAITAAMQDTSVAPEAEHGNAFVNLGNVYSNLGDCNRAISAYEQGLATAQHVSFYTAYSNLAQCYIDLGKYAQAVATLKQAIPLLAKSSDQLSLQYAEANAYVDEGQIRQASDILKLLIGESATPNSLRSSASTLLEALPTQGARR